MKLKFYLRGMGLGVLLTAIIMGVALGGSKKVSDAEIVKRAKQLGMVEAESTLSDYSEAVKSSEEEMNADATSDQAMDKKGEEVSEKVDEEQSSSGESVSEVASKEKEDASAGKSSESIEAEADIALSEKNAENAASTDSIFSAKPEEVSNEAKEEKAEEKVEEKVEAQTEETVSNIEATKAEEAVEEKKEEKQEEVKEEKPAENTEQTSVQAEAPAQTDNSAAAASEVSYTVVVLPSGSGSDRCAVVLRDAGLVDDALAFNKYLVDRGIDRKIRSGTKQIPKDSSYEEIAAIITR